MDNKHLRSLCVSIALGLSIILLISFIVSGGFVLPKNSGGWLYAYQTLVAGVLAFVGAGGTVYYLRKQLRYEIEEKFKIRRKKGLVNRARLPDALLELTNYSKECFKFIDDKNLQLPDPPNGSIEVLRKNLEFLEEKDAYTMFEIISFFQILNARVSSFRDSKTNYKEKNIKYDITLFNAYILHLFSFSRNEILKIGRIFPSEKMIHDSFRSLYGDNYYYDWNTTQEELLKFIKNKRKEDEDYLEKFNFDYQKVNADKLRQRMPRI